MRKRLLLILGGAFFALQFLCAGGGIYRYFTAPTPASDPGWFATTKGGSLVIVTAPPESRLKPDDEIVAVGGRVFSDPAELLSTLQHLQPGTQYTIVIRREGELQSLVLRTQPVALLHIALLRAAFAIILAIFLVTGFAVFLLKPSDKQALLLALMFGMFTGYFPLFSVSDLPLWFSVLVTGSRVISLFAWPVFFHFFLTFPEPSPLLKRFPKFEFYLYLPYLLLFFPYGACAVLAELAPARFSGLAHSLAWVGELGSRLIILYVAGGLLSLLVNYNHANLSSRRKMRVVVAGSIVGFLPPLLVTGAIELFDLARTNPELLRLLGLSVLFTAPVFPLAFAYAIVRHQVIPVRLILRRGVRYIFVSQGSIVLEMIAVFLSLAFLLYSFFNYLNNVSELEIGVISGVVSIFVWEITGFLHRRVIAPAIDRRFFRQSYNAQQVLSELGAALRRMTDVKEITSLVCARIQDALQVENVCFFFMEEESGNYALAAYVDSAPEGEPSDWEGLRLAGNSSSIERLRIASSPLAVDFGDPKSWASRLASAAMRGSEEQESEYTALKLIKAALLVPVATKDLLLGVVSLGQRLGDLPFSGEDRQLLLALAWQMSFAIENSRLLRQMVEEERLKRELEMATEVQRRLFPNSQPDTESLELFGVCHPARGVGGDYYDFLILENGRIGIAVADVAGKGISAALLMSIVQASLRSQASSVDGQVTELVASMNRLLHKSTGASGYATFFYAQFDERTRRLTYVNAGHNPPILIKPGGWSRSARAAGIDPAQPSIQQPPAHPTNQFGEPTMGHLQSASLNVAKPHGLELTDADANPPDLAGDECVRPLTIGGVVIGLFDSSQYEQETIQMERGDLIVAYTDGVTEAVNSNFEEFGEARLRRIVQSSAHLPASAISAEIIQAVQTWCGDTPQQDDLTLVILRVK
ncbi:MAG TPA: SpoIIE family protein phosphatase [Blastocatellia bacterium]|nr:SpoIIE family protein phosphatase [Blastocatellia bacterium]